MTQITLDMPAWVLQEIDKCIGTHVASLAMTDQCPSNIHNSKETLMRYDTLLRGRAIIQKALAADLERRNR